MKEKEHRRRGSGQAGGKEKMRRERDVERGKVEEVAD